MMPTSGLRLDGKVAVVTGGSRGLGRVMAQALADDGANVVVASRKEEVCISLAEELETRTGRTALGIGCHVGRWEECDRLVARVYERLGRIDVLVNNAGMSPLYPSLEEVSEELFDKVMSVNLKGAFRLSTLIGSRMRDAGEGSILNISSIAAVRPTEAEVPYAMAKAGMNTMTRGLARAFAPSVRVNAIMPGMFATDIAAAWDHDKVSEAERELIPLQRVGVPEELIEAARFLVGPGGSYVTGSVVTVDGGLTL